jgi:hypothetical protein
MVTSDRVIGPAQPRRHRWDAATPNARQEGLIWLLRHRQRSREASRPHPAEGRRPGITTGLLACHLTARHERRGHPVLHGGPKSLHPEGYLGSKLALAVAEQKPRRRGLLPGTTHGGAEPEAPCTDRPDIRAATSNGCADRGPSPWPAWWPPPWRRPGTTTWQRISPAGASGGQIAAGLVPGWMRREPAPDREEEANGHRCR